MFRFHKLFVHCTLLLTVPSLSLYPQTNVSVLTKESVQTLLKIDQFFTFDDFLNFLKGIQEGELEKYSEDDLEKIIHLLIALARQGILPHETEKASILEQDIQKLLKEEDEDEEEYSFSFHYGNDYFFAPATSYDHSDIILCKKHKKHKKDKKNWFEKIYKKVAEFVEDHTTEVIVGAILVVIVVIISTVLGTKTEIQDPSKDEEENKDKSNPKAEANTLSSPGEPSASSSVVAAIEESPNLKSALEEPMGILKELVEDENILPPSNMQNSDSSFAEKVKTYASMVAHQFLDGISEITSFAPMVLEEMQEINRHATAYDITSLHKTTSESKPTKTYEKLVTAGHEKIDQLFSTDQASYYSPEAKEAMRNKYVFSDLPPPVLFSQNLGIAKLKDIINTGKETIPVAKELGFSSKEISKLEQSGALKKTLIDRVNRIYTDQALLSSFDRFIYAEAYLKPYGGQYLPEMQIRELIHQAGIRTFPRPTGIPENFRVKLSNNGVGMKYVHPDNEQTYVRVMPGKLHAKYPHQQKPYVIQMKNGKILDNNGNIVDKSAAEAHISLEEYVYKN